MKSAALAATLTLAMFTVCKAQTDATASIPPRQACAGDVARFCASAPDLRSRQQCLTNHGPELSGSCRAAREASSAPTNAAAANGISSAVAARVSGRRFPSVFAPWNYGTSRAGFEDTPDASTSGANGRLASIARHDLYWDEWGSLGLKLADERGYVVLSPQFSPESIQAALRTRDALLRANPNLVILANIHYFAVGANSNWIPPNSPWWRAAGRINEYNSRKLDFTNPDFQDRVAAVCAALVRTSVFDGCMLDLWNDQWDDRQDYAREASARLPLIQKIRTAAGDQAILVANVNGALPTSTAAYLNGMYMEGLGSSFFADWRTAAGNLLWAQSHLRQPIITALEGWYACPTPDCRDGDPAQIQQQGRADLARMRSVTTLALVFSNGYALFSDPNALPTPDHLHAWYPFWDKSLGAPTSAIADLNQPNLSGAYSRQFQNGEVVFNPPTNHPVTVSFAQPMRSVATGQTARTFSVETGDGDFFLRAGFTQ